MVLAVYWPVGSFPFIHFDDVLYVSENPVVQKGLTGEGFAWAFTTFHAANWHPLTWLSHMADVELFGLDAGWHHRANAALHALNSILLFLILRGLTGAGWRSGFAAALFAVHPLHVESVAWVSERKDVLSTLLMLLTIQAYARYVRRPSLARYLGVFFLFAAGLMAKPMLVTLPFLLLLLDLWPLERFASSGRDGEIEPAPSGVRRIFPLLFEKTPLLALSLGSCVVTYIAQESGRAVAYLEHFPFGVRAANAAISYLKYLGNTFFPSRLAIFYPHSVTLGGIPAREASAALAVLVLITLAAVRQARKRPFLVVGWLWYLGTLVPVIGLVQVGQQAMADRYTYVPLIGVFMAVSWAVPDIPRGGTFRKGLLAACASVVLLGLCWTARRQVGYWRSGIDLFTRAFEVSPDNQETRSNLGAAHNNAGMELFSLGKAPEAAFHFREALRLRPFDVTVMLNLGAAEASQGNFGEAVELFRKVLELRPGEERARRNLEMAIEAGGRNR